MRRWRQLASVGVVVLLLAGGVAGTSVTTTETDTPASSTLLVDVASDGDARFVVTIGFNLSTTGERDSFETLRQNETKQDGLLEPFAERMQRVAARAENETDREMSVTNATMRFEKTDDGAQGIAALEVSWQNLAAESGDDLVVTEPFASGFTTDRRFVVRAPAGYTVASAAPTPTETGSASAVWSAGQTLEGFEVTLTPTTPTTTTPSAAAGGTDATTAKTTTGSGPGFGVVAALIGAVCGLVAASRR